MITQQPQPDAVVSYPATWTDSLVRVATVGGLAMGSVIAAALTAAASLSLGWGQFITLAALAFVGGASVSGSALYLDYVKAHLHLDLTQSSLPTKAISFFATLVILYVAAALLSFLMIPILLVGFLYIRAKRQRGRTWREQIEMFITEAMPRIAVL